MVSQLTRVALIALAAGLMSGCGAKEEGVKGPLSEAGGVKDTNMTEWSAANAGNGKPGEETK